jgi:hypothetical protein
MNINGYEIYFILGVTTQEKCVVRLSIISFAKKSKRMPFQSLTQPV